MDHQSDPDAHTKTLLSTAQTYLQIFTTLDPSTIHPIQTPTYTHSFAPVSANIPASFTRETFAQHIIHLRDVLSSFPVHAKEMWPNPSLNQVTIWAESETVFHQALKDGGDDEEWRYQGEYVFVLWMDETGQRVERVWEFLDSLGTERLRGLMGRARKRLAEVEGGDEGEIKGVSTDSGRNVW